MKAVFDEKSSKNGIYTEESYFELKIKTQNVGHVKL
jgi:hypothetical protein